MRSIYTVLHKLREQEKRRKHVEFAQAETERQRQEDMLQQMHSKLMSERERIPNTIGMMIVADYMNMQRHLDIVSAESELVEQTELVEVNRSEMKTAQVECKVMEEVISSIQSSERKEFERKLSIVNDEIGTNSWRRKQ